MDSTYVPAGRWVRVRIGAGAEAALQGRWHLATEDPRFSFSLAADRALLACGRTLAATRPATPRDAATSLAVSDDLPRTHVCSICTERYVRDRLFEIRVHNLTTASPA